MGTRERQGNAAGRWQADRAGRLREHHRTQGSGECTPPERGLPGRGAAIEPHRQLRLEGRHRRTHLVEGDVSHLPMGRDDEALDLIDAPEHPPRGSTRRTTGCRPGSAHRQGLRSRIPAVDARRFGEVRPRDGPRHARRQRQRRIHRLGDRRHNREGSRAKIS